MQTHVSPLMTFAEGQQIWQKMLAEAQDRDLMAPAGLRTALKLLLLGATFALALSAAWLAPRGMERVLAAFVLSMIMAQFAFIGHDAGHRSLVRSAGLNRIFGQLSMTLVSGMPFGVWYGIHHTHHQYCQNEGKDPDMEVNLFVSLTEQSAAQKGPLGRFFTRHQGLTIWFLSLAFAHSQRHQYQFIALKNLRRYPIDGLFLLAHYFLWFGLPFLAFDLSFAALLLAYVLPLFFLGPHLAAIFWINHIGMPLIKDPRPFSFFEHQAVSSRTILNPRGFNWLFGGLNFQIEHHLFPQIPSFRLHELQAIVSAHIQDTPVAYACMSWPEAVASIARHFTYVARLPQAASASFAANHER